MRGAGHHTIGRAIFGQSRCRPGHIALDGRRVDPADPADAMRKQIGFVSSRRGEESLAANMVGAREPLLNPVATGTGHASRSGAAAKLPTARRAPALLGQAARPERAVATLSGGNQQKVVVARWMEAKVRLLVLEEPTIGVDVGSKAEIYHLLQHSLKEGLAVLLISSDFEEVERICHRALVFSRGRVVSEIPRDELTIARLTADASGGGRRSREGATHERQRLERYVGPAITRAISVWGLLVLLVLLIIVFSLLRPDTFPTLFNIKSILNNKSVQALWRSPSSSR